MEGIPLIERLKQARLVQALVLYAGASWLMLQFVATLKELFALPDWIGGATVVLLGAGLVVVIATAWVQSLQSTTAAEEAGELPTDWEIDPADAIASLKAGRLPHLTWGRALLGGIVAFSLAIGAAGGYVLVSGAPGSGASADDDSEAAPAGIAVLPFRVTGPGLDNYREGLPSLVATNIDGVDQLRSIHTRSVMAAWGDAFGEAREVALEDALGVAAETGARYAVVGEALALGETVRLNAELFDLLDDTRVGEGTAEGPMESMLSLIDQMSISLLREILGTRGDQSVTEIQRLSGLVTESIEALDAYVEGEAYFGRGRWPEALDAYERAVEADSTFALAWGRVGDVYGWWTGATRIYDDPLERALRFSDRLPTRTAMLLRLSDYGVPNANIRADSIRRYTRRYPDDPEGWEVLVEFLAHRGAVIEEPGELDLGLSKTVELDPQHAPYYVHFLRYLVAVGDSVRFDEHNGRWIELQDGERAYAYQAVWDYFRGSPDAFDRARSYFRERGDTALFLNLIEVWMRDEGILDRTVLALDDIEDGAAGVAGSVPVFRAHLALNRGQAFDVAADTTNFGLLVRMWFGVHDVLVGRPGATLLADIRDAATGFSRGASPEERQAFEQDVEAFATAVSRFDERDYTGAIEALDATPWEGDRLGFVVTTWWPILRAEALARTGRTEAAIRYFEDQLQAWRAFSRLRLGELYEETGSLERARENYEAFLFMYAEADESGAELRARGEEGLARVTG